MNNSVLYQQASLEVSVEEPVANEEAKSSEVEKKVDEDEEKKTDKKEEEEEVVENKVVAVDTTVLNEIKKEESTNSKLNCYNIMYQVPFEILMKACSFFLFLNVQK
jgi:hypothetical protein